MGLLRLLVLMAFALLSLPALGQSRGGGRGSTGIHGDNAVLTFSDGTLTLGAMPSSGYVLYYNGSTITGLNKGSANGLATLGSDGRVPTAQLPSSTYSLTGTWNASTDLTSPGGISLSGTTPSVGTAYAVTTAGSTALGSVSSWTAGDLAVYTAAGWAKIPAAGVTSFNSRYGAVVPVAGDYNDLALSLAGAGVSGFRLPQGTSCSQTAEGAACWDTDDNLLTVGDSSSRKTMLDTAAAALAYQPLDGDLTALAGVTSTADKVPYFTGSGTADVTTVTSAARTVLDDTTTAAMLTTLNARTAWTIPSTITGTDTAACWDWQRYDGTGVGDWTITLPTVSGTSGCEICWKEIGGDAASTITVDANGAETIDNAANFTMTVAYGETCVISDGSEWWRK